MKTGKNKIFCELIEEKKESLVILAEEGKKNFIKGKVLGLGYEVVDVKEGNEIVVFNVYPQQILEYEGKKVFFVNADEAFYLVK